MMHCEIEEPPTAKNENETKSPKKSKHLESSHLFEEKSSLNEDTKSPLENLIAPTLQLTVSNAMKYSESCERLTDFWCRPSELETERIQKSIETKLISTLDTRPKVFHMRDIIPSLSQGAQVVVQDDFSLCFATPNPDPWNWNPFLYILWCIGIFIRYCIFFPLRLFIFISGTFFFFVFFMGIRLSVKANTNQRLSSERLALRFLANIWILSWTGVIRYHGVIPKHEPNQIYVANHTSMIDFVLLQQVCPFAAIGQKHRGWVGYFQELLKPALGGIWFERGESKDRKRATDIIRQYISKAGFERNRVLIFPEGTCVNMQFCIQFKRGAFDVGATICPIAIKYNHIFVSAYWNSREKSFQRHLFDLMTSWALVCDIYFLEPQTMMPGEDAIKFAQRIKDMICDAAQIQGVDWNGYLKYFRPSKRFVEQRQKLFAESLLKRQKMSSDGIIASDSTTSLENGSTEILREPIPSHQNSTNIDSNIKGQVLTCESCNGPVHINGTRVDNSLCHAASAAVTTFVDEKRNPVVHRRIRVNMPEESEDSEN